MFTGSTPSDMPPTAPKGWEWIRNPGRPCQWTLACNTRDVCWSLAADARTAWYLQNTTPKG